MCGGFVANNFVAFNHGRYAHSGGAILRLLVDADDLAHGANKYFGATRHFGGQSKCEVQLGPCAEILVNGEINTPRGNVPRFPVPKGCFFFYRRPNDHRKRQIISTCCATLCHFPLDPNFLLMSIVPDHELGAIDVPNWSNQFIVQSLVNVPWQPIIYFRRAHYVTTQITCNAKLRPHIFFVLHKRKSLKIMKEIVNKVVGCRVFQAGGLLPKEVIDSACRR